MKLHHITIFVKDLSKSLAFYQKLTGLNIHKQIEDNGTNVVYLCDEEGDTEVELVCVPGGNSFSGKGMFMCFATDDVEAAHKKAVELELSPSDIRHPEPDAKYFYVYDPDGVSVQLREYK